MRLQESNLVPVRMQVSVANEAGPRLFGAVFVKLKGHGGLQARVMLNVVTGVHDLK